MKKYLVSAVAALGALVATVGTAACIVIVFDEPHAPKSMIEG